MAEIIGRPVRITSISFEGARGVDLIVLPETWLGQKTHVPDVVDGPTITAVADFGVLGMAICFDVNFPEVWQGLAHGGAEVVAWPSEYAGGTTLQAHALMNHYYIVSATQAGQCLVYDIT